MNQFHITHTVIKFICNVKRLIIIINPHRTVILIRNIGFIQMFHYFIFGKRTLFAVWLDGDASASFFPHRSILFLLRQMV